MQFLKRGFSGSSSTTIRQFRTHLRIAQSKSGEIRECTHLNTKIPSSNAYF
jgi:hypothetical protein